MILLSFCTFPWWLAWLLPFLLGLALGWAWWSKYKSIAANLEGDVSRLNGRIAELEGDLKNCQHKSADLVGEVSIAKGKMREAEEALNTYLTSSGKSSSGKSSSGKSSSGKSSGGKSTSGKSSAELAAASGIAASNLTSSDDASPKKSAPKGGGSKSIYGKLASDNLQIIEGVGPKMEEVMKANGVNNWSDLAANSQSDLRAILGKYGDKYKIIDVETWQQQAQYAANGDFDGLITMQKSIDGGSAKTLSKSDSKLEKYLIKTGAIKRYKQDDLKAIEGVGPKIAGLLKAAGLNTWRDVANSTSESIKQILDDAGPRYKLADPGTWPKQAELAADGKFDELKEYQDFLQGGK